MQTLYGLKAHYPDKVELRLEFSDDVDLKVKVPVRAHVDPLGTLELEVTDLTPVKAAIDRAYLRQL